MNKINYQKEFEKQLNSDNKGKKLLLHACCAPCSSACLERVADFFDTTVFYYNPNIDNEKEFWHRADEEKRFIEEVYGDKVKLIIPTYDKQQFYSVAKGFEDAKEGGARCVKCFNLRLQTTAQYAKDNNFDFFATTLTLSPMKDSQLLNRLGERISEETGVNWLYSDFKKLNGYKRSCELSREHNLYRQDYCGCSYSQKEAEERRKGRL